MHHRYSDCADLSSADTCDPDDNDPPDLERIEERVTCNLCREYMGLDPIDGCCPHYTGQGRKDAACEGCTGGED
jgi:hypothetical protein